MKAVILGSGNVATHLVQALAKKIDIIQIFSHTLSNAQSLASKIGCQNATSNLSDIITNADLYIISVKDDAIQSILERAPHVNAESIWLHTSGSKGIDVYAPNKFHNFGVLYPLQTFSKDVELEMSKVPFFIEGNDKATTQKIEEIAHLLSDKVYFADSEKRKRMHIAAVFACNFTNHLWLIADSILKGADIPFEVLMPLINATVDKIKQTTPYEAQTGPAVRCDMNVINNHLDLLSGIHKKIYQLISKDIISTHNKK